MRPARIDGEIVIARPVEEVFDFVADVRNEPRYNASMRRVELLTPGPIGTGTRFREQMGSGRGRVTTMTTEYTACERPQRLDSVTRMRAMDVAGTLTFEPVGAGTRMRWHWRLQPRGALRLLGPIVARSGARMERAIWTQLKRLLETPSR